ncbi:MAG TPA: peptidase U35, partial [Ramlibacter sp.]
MPQAQQLTTRREDLPIAGRSMDLNLRSFHRAAPAEGESAPLATCEIVFSAGARVQRYDWYRERYFLEELVVEEGAIRMERLQRGAPLLNSHYAWDLESQLGVVESPAIRDGKGTCQATFSRRESVAGYVQDVADGVIRSVSVGYARHRIEMIAPEQEGGMWVYRVVDWEPMEVSLVTIPADMDSQVVRSAGGPLQLPDGRELRAFPCEFIETRAAGAATQSPAVGASADITTNPGARSMTPEELAAAEAKRTADEHAARKQVAADATRAEQARSAEITDLCERHGCAKLATGLIRDGKTVEEARKAVLDERAARDAATGGHRNVNGVQTVRDEHDTRLAGIEDAILHRVLPNHKLSDNGRQYRGMSLIELGRDMLEAGGVSTRGMDRLTLATRILHFRSGGMHTTGDFASLFANVANKRLRNAYEENAGTYGLWARRAPNAPDFKSMSVVQL